MFHRFLNGISTVLGIAALVAGCAGTHYETAPVAAAVPLGGDVAGTWQGSFGQVAASLYTDEGRWVVHINDDGTFNATVRPNVGANNRAKAAAWSGTVGVRSDRIVLESSNAQWPWLTLMRSDDGRLYGVAVDPVAEAQIMMTLERAGATQAP